MRCHLRMVGWDRSNTLKDNGKLIGTYSYREIAVAGIIGATAKWQSDGQNTLLAHGHAVEKCCPQACVGVLRCDRAKVC